MYDPELGRFLSADIVVQDVTNLQAWNAYSYVLNNPLSMTDPTGFFFKAIFKAIGNFFKAIFRAVKSVIKAIAKIPIVGAIVKIAACAPWGPGIGACLGVTAALTIGAGGSLADALIATALSIAQIPAGAFVESIVSEVARTAAGLAHIVGVAAQGVVQGAMTVAQGGEFLAGFVAGAIGAAGRLAAGTFGNGNIIAETAIVATAGGIGAELSGGKFANGAVTAAFAYAYAPGNRERILGTRSSTAAMEHTVTQQQTTYVIDEQNFVIVGGSQAQRDDAYFNLLVLFSTPKGAEMFSAIASRRTWLRGNRIDFEIRLRPGYNNAQAPAPGNFIIVDPIMARRTRTTAGFVPTTMLRQMAHEFGHAAFGLKNEYLTIQNAENPVMNYLGYPSAVPRSSLLSR